MSVAGQVAQYLVWSTERPFGVGNPVDDRQLGNKVTKTGRMGEFTKLAVKSQPTCGKSLL